MTQEYALEVMKNSIPQRKKREVLARQLTVHSLSFWGVLYISVDSKR